MTVGRWSKHLTCNQFRGNRTRKGTGRGRGHVKPLPLSLSEVERIFKQTTEQEPVLKIDMSAGDKIITFRSV